MTKCRKKRRIFVQNDNKFFGKIIHLFTNEKGEKVVIPPCPIKIWHGTADTVVDHVVSVEYIKAVRRGGCYGELRLIEGIGHQIIPAMQTELRMWFDRFI